MKGKNMFERMLDKTEIPTTEKIQETIGLPSVKRLERLEVLLKDLYDLNRELKFPFGKSYGWGYKYSHKSKHLCYLLFEQGAFTILTQIGDKEVPSLDKKLPDLLQKTRQLWENRYPCGEYGGWIYYRILEDEELEDIMELLKIKVKPIKK